MNPFMGLEDASPIIGLVRIHPLDMWTHVIHNAEKWSLVQ
jgi:hypothetical protein